MRLRSEAIRIAASLPKGDETRRKILALLKRESRGGEWKETLQGDDFRARWDDYGTLLIEEMPGKPVKRKVRRFRVSTRWILQGQWLHPSGPLLIQNLMRDIKLRRSMSYEQAKAAAMKGLDMAADKLRSEAARLQEKYPDGPYQTPERVEEVLKKIRFPDAQANEETVSWLEVEPKDYKPISFGGKDFAGTSEWHEFVWYDEADRDDWMAQMEGMRAFHKSTSKGAARKLFKLLKANPDAVKRMTAREFEQFLAKSKIGYRYVPTVWR